MSPARPPEVPGLSLGRPGVMGILNVTPDSFSDGGQHFTRDTALAQALLMVAQGVDLIDIGGESTRPGAATVTAQQELDRVLPAIEAIRAHSDVPISVDTSKPEVMRAAVGAGAMLINDIRALSEPGALEAAAALDVPVCLMHMQGTPIDMQVAPHYDDVVSEVLVFLVARREAAVAAGIAREHVLFDPGFGFGKTLGHNLALLQNMGKLAELAPVISGLSRKRMIGRLLGGGPSATPGDRVIGSVTAALAAVVHGACIVRVHDVAETVQALTVWRGLHESPSVT